MPLKIFHTRFFSRARDWYGRFERPISSLSLIGGFLFDALTLHRVDLFWENVWVVGHLLIVAGCAVWINLLENAPSDAGVRPEADPRRLHFWLVNAMQFFFGGILSTYLVFYFRSGTLAASWPFLFLLAIAFIANESFKRHYARLTFQLSLLFLAFYAFAIYLVPVLMKEVSTRAFLLSGIFSLTLIGIVIIILGKFAQERFRGAAGRRVMIVLVAITVLINGLYFLHLIPPLPLSLKEAGMYHDLRVLGPGHYAVRQEVQNEAGFWGKIYNFFQTEEIVRVAKGEKIFAYTAVFAPTALKVNIIHEWQHRDVAQGAWITRGRIAIPVTGGSNEGWGTYSYLFEPAVGHWRINVLAPSGALIGRLSFRVAGVADGSTRLINQEIQ